MIHWDMTTNTYSTIHINDVDVRTLRHIGYKFFCVKIDWNYEGQLDEDDIENQHDTSIQETVHVIAANEWLAERTAFLHLGDTYSPAGDAWADVSDATTATEIEPLGLKPTYYTISINLEP